MQASIYWTLLDGLIVTVRLTAWASVLATVVALIAGTALAFGNRPLRWLFRVYVEIFRGTSLLVQLFWIYYVLPQSDISLDPFVSGVVAIALNSGAYGGEAVRAALAAVPKGQIEAAASLGLPRWLTVVKVVMPQAIGFLLPQWGNFLIEGMKATAIVSFISIADLSFAAYQINGRTFDTLRIYGVALLVYFALSQLLVLPARLLEARFRRRLNGGAIDTALVTDPVA